MVPILTISQAALFALMLQCSNVLALDLITVDFVTDKAFPDPQAKNEEKREFAKSMSYNKNDLLIIVTGENEFGGAVEVSRRGPGGLGVKGNGDRNAEGQGTTSGNRVNNGEALILRFMNYKNEPQPVFVRSVVIDRIVRDTKHFPAAGVTTYKLMAGDKTIGTGKLPVKAGSTRGGPISISVEMSEAATELRITNGTPFHPIANRFRVAAISLTP